MHVHFVRRRRWLRIFSITVFGTAVIGCASNAVLDRDDGIQSTKNPEIIERGRHLAYGPAHCASCHGDPDHLDELRAGREIPLSGGRVFELGPLGSMVAPNITSDPATGIGARTDEDLVRHLRYGISADGRALAPLMPFQDLTDEDLQAIISFLRTLPPVRNDVKHRLNLVGRLTVEHLLRPVQPEKKPAAALAAVPTAEYGRYLAHTVANCAGCHTKRSKLTGAMVGEPFAGGMVLTEGGKRFVAPDITAADSGILHGLSERQFLARFRARAAAPTGSPMPWEAFSSMTDEELRAIYAYLSNFRNEPSG